LLYQFRSGDAHGRATAFEGAGAESDPVRFCHLFFQVRFICRRAKQHLLSLPAILPSALMAKTAVVSGLSKPLTGINFFIFKVVLIIPDSRMAFKKRAGRGGNVCRVTPALELQVGGILLTFQVSTSFKGAFLFELSRKYF
jgi:hypothetical protein